MNLPLRMLCFKNRCHNLLLMCPSCWRKFFGTLLYPIWAFLINWTTRFETDTLPYSKISYSLYGIDTLVGRGNQLINVSLNYQDSLSNMALHKVCNNFMKKNRRCLNPLVKLRFYMINFNAVLTLYLIASFLHSQS